MPKSPALRQNAWLGRGLAPYSVGSAYLYSPRFLWECLASQTVSWVPAPPLQTHRADFQQWAYLLASDQGLRGRLRWLADIGHNVNPWLDSETAVDCFTKRFPQGIMGSFAQQEYGGDDKNWGWHFH